MTKLLIIGFDGMDYRIAKRTIKKYNFDFKLDLHKLKVKVPLTGPSWTSFYTGLNMDVHGVYDGWGTDHHHKKSNCFKDIKKHCFWKIIEKKGFKVITYNLPITSEGFPFDKSNKKDIINWVYNSLKHYEWAPEIRKKGIKKIIKKIEKDNFDIIKNLRCHGADLVFIQFSFIDRIGHAFTFRRKKTIKLSYNLAYKIIHKLYKKINPEKLMVVSDHGFSLKYSTHNKSKEGIFITNKNLLNNLKSIKNNYINQTDIFDEILDIFDIDYKKETKKIPKKNKIQLSKREEKKIKQKLKALGYI